MIKEILQKLLAIYFMIEQLRLLLYYPLGLLPSLFFTLRILIQWIQSEKYKKSYTGKTFWYLSISGNILLLLHYIIQVQYPFALLQAGNAGIAWRNLDLMKHKKKRTTSQVIVLFFGLLIFVTVIFMMQCYLIIGKFDWIRMPSNFFDENTSSSLFFWHVLGVFGAVLFAGRFWIQWWMAEKYQTSELGKSFWWMSILGSLISLVYFVKIRDTVSMINYGFGLIPYIRNLILYIPNVSQKLDLREQRNRSI